MGRVNSAPTGALGPPIHQIGAEQSVTLVELLTKCARKCHYSILYHDPKYERVYVLIEKMMEEGVSFSDIDLHDP